MQLSTSQMWGVFTWSTSGQYVMHSFGNNFVRAQHIRVDVLPLTVVHGLAAMLAQLSGSCHVPIG